MVYSDLFSILTHNRTRPVQLIVHSCPREASILIIIWTCSSGMQITDEKSQKTHVAANEEVYNMRVR